MAQVTINDIQQQMNEHYEKNTALREENLELANKLKGLIEQYELREQVGQASLSLLCVCVLCTLYWPTSSRASSSSMNSGNRSSRLASS